MPDYFHGPLNILIEKSTTMKGLEVHLCKTDNGDVSKVRTKLQTMPLCPYMQYNRTKLIVHCNSVCAKSRMWRAGGCAKSRTWRAKS